MVTNLIAAVPSTRAGTTVAAGLRFHLAEDRIREFLMGENLYGDPSLALRELYQNAVDACRLSVARFEFLDRAPAEPHDVSAGIEFEQGVDADGRMFVDCVDNGSGMGLDEITVAFCQAGVRASDLSEHENEIADFAAAVPPVDFWPNSRFGIGVMSYFMIADAMTVTTARLNRDGTVGRLLSFHIPGPSRTFEVSDHGAAELNGTRVRLWLKPGVITSAVSTLRELVLVCPFHLRAMDQRGFEHRWSPHELNRASTKLPVGAHAVAVPGVFWWVKDVGGVLADGIWANSRTRGMIVNLTGRHAPTLTADRTRIIRLDDRAVEEQAIAATAAGIEGAWHIVGNAEWLSGISRLMPRVADGIVAGAAAHDRKLMIHGAELDLARAGFLPDDEDSFIYNTPSGLLRWRLSRFAAGGLFASSGLPRPEDIHIEPAQPSDGVLLGLFSWMHRSGGDQMISPWTPTPASLYDAERHLRYPIGRIAARARALGLPVPDDAGALPASSDIVRAALSFSQRTYADGSIRSISAFDVILAAWQLGVPTTEVVSHLDQRSIACDPFARTLSGPPELGLLVAASENANGIAPWIGTSDEIGLDNVISASRSTLLPIENILRGLADLGFDRLPSFRFDVITPTDDDVLMLSWDLDGRTPFLRGDRIAPLGHLAKASKLLNRPEAELAQRFSSFGVEFSAEAAGCEEKEMKKKEVLKLLGLPESRRTTLSRRQLKLMSRYGDGTSPWIDPRQPVPAWFIAILSLRGHTIDEILHEYRQLGYEAEDPRKVPLVGIPELPMEWRTAER